MSGKAIYFGIWLDVLPVESLHATHRACQRQPPIQALRRILTSKQELSDPAPSDRIQ